MVDAARLVGMIGQEEAAMVVGELPNHTRKLLIALGKCEQVVARCPKVAPNVVRVDGRRGKVSPGVALGYISRTMTISNCQTYRQAQMQLCSKTTELGIRPLYKRSGPMRKTANIQPESTSSRPSSEQPSASFAQPLSSPALQC